MGRVKVIVGLRVRLRFRNAVKVKVRVRVKLRFRVRCNRLGKGRAEDAARFVTEHRLPADHVRYERLLAQLSGQTCGAAAGEDDQLQLAGEHMRPHRLDERSDGHGLNCTTHTNKGEDGLRL